jgi:hypothetical protein
MGMILGARSTEKKRPGFLTWLKSLFKKPPQADPNDIVIHLSQENRELLEWWGLKTGLSLPVLIERGAVLSIPVEERRKFLLSPKVGELLEAAYRSVDDADDEADFAAEGIMPLLPLKSSKEDPFVGEESEEENSDELPKDRPIPGHPCLLIRPSVDTGTGLRAGDYAGACGAKGENNRPCYWAPGVARNCPLFRGSPQKGL